jgi:hypothetical protein
MWFQMELMMVAKIKFYKETSVKVTIFLFVCWTLKHVQSANTMLMELRFDICNVGIIYAFDSDAMYI